MHIEPRPPADRQPARLARRLHLELQVAEGLAPRHALVQRGPAFGRRPEQSDLVVAAAQQRGGIAARRHGLRRRSRQPAQAALAIGFPVPVGRQIGQRLPAPVGFPEHAFHAAGQRIEGRGRPLRILAQVVHRIAPGVAAQLVGELVQRAAHAPALAPQRLHRQQQRQRQRREQAFQRQLELGTALVELPAHGRQQRGRLPSLRLCGMQRGLEFRWLAQLGAQRGPGAGKVGQFLRLDRLVLQLRAAASPVGRPVRRASDPGPSGPRPGRAAARPASARRAAPKPPVRQRFRSAGCRECGTAAGRPRPRSACRHTAAPANAAAHPGGGSWLAPRGPRWRGPGARCAGLCAIPTTVLLVRPVLCRPGVALRAGRCRHPRRSSRRAQCRDFRAAGRLGLSPMCGVRASVERRGARRPVSGSGLQPTRPLAGGRPFAGIRLRAGAVSCPAQACSMPLRVWRSARPAAE